VTAFTGILTILKWLVALASIGYRGGVVVLFLLQRSFVFLIPQTIRTSPEAAGFPEAEEHVLATADGENVIGTCRQNRDRRSCFIFPAMEYSYGFPKRATMIWTITVRLKALDNSSAFQEADGSQCLAHGPFPGL
jgi:hypothetical protein